MSEKLPTVQEILWQNIKKIMELEYGKVNVTRLAAETKIGGSASRIKALDTSIGINVLTKIARRFDLQPWHLLLPGLDPANAPVSFLTKEEEQLHLRLKEAHAIVTRVR